MFNASVTDPHRDTRLCLIISEQTQYVEAMCYSRIRIHPKSYSSDRNTSRGMDGYSAENRKEYSKKQVLVRTMVMRVMRVIVHEYKNAKKEPMGFASCLIPIAQPPMCPHLTDIGAPLRVHV